jgi:hypothetical protein
VASVDKSGTIIEDGAVKKGRQCRSGVVGWALAVTALLIAVPPLASATAVVPNAQAAVEGDESNVYPFHCSVLQTSQRYQQIYLGSEVGTGVITEIRFRQDGVFGGAFGPTITNGITITLSSTTAAPDGLSNTFASNIGADVTTVFSGDLTLSSATSAAVPRPFDIVILLQTPFSFNPSGGLNLLLDVTIPTCVSTTLFDMQNSDGDSVSRAATSDSGSGSLTADFSDTRGLITQFTTGVSPPPIPTLSEWAQIGMALILVAVAIWGLRRRRTLGTA